MFGEALSTALAVVKEALEAAVGASDVVETIFGEPYGVADVVSALRRALRDRSPGGGEG